MFAPSMVLRAADAAIADGDSATKIKNVMSLGSLTPNPLSLEDKPIVLCSLRQK